MWNSLAKKAAEQGTTARVLANDVLQYLLLDQLSQDRLSVQTALIRGGAVRFGHAGERFVDHLDFLHSLDEEELNTWIDRSLSRMEIRLPAYLGAGKLSVKLRRDVKRTQGCQLSLRYAREGAWEQIQATARLHPGETGSWYADAIVDPQGLLPVPPVVMLPSLGELMADIVVSMAEERKLQGRDLYDLWWLGKMTGRDVPMEAIQRQLSGAKHAGLRRNLKAMLSRMNADRVALDAARFLPRDQKKELDDGNVWAEMTLLGVEILQGVLA